jgi:hypothetical protein
VVLEQGERLWWWLTTTLTILMVAVCIRATLTLHPLWTTSAGS